MKNVSRFEANLLHLAHFFLQQAPWQQAQRLLEDSRECPRCLSRNAVQLVQDALSKGCVLLLTRRGAWRRERFLRQEQIAEGRLWNRTPPKELGLHFSRASLDLLIWLTANTPSEEKKRWECPAEPTVGDLFLCFLVHEAIHLHDVPKQIIQQDPFPGNALTWLAYPGDFGKMLNNAQPLLDPWMSGVGACILEAFQPVLIERWIQMEMDKGQIKNWQRMRELGLAQERVLTGFLDAVEKQGRKDLARFLLHASAKILTETATAQSWTESLSQQSAPKRMVDRADTYRGALALLRVLPRLRQWDRQAQSVGYFDEDYASSQLFKADWELVDGDTLTERATQIIRDVDPMRQTEETS